MRMRPWACLLAVLAIGCGSPAAPDHPPSPAPGEAAASHVYSVQQVSRLQVRKRCLNLCRRLDCGSLRRCVLLCQRSFRPLVSAGEDDRPGLLPDDDGMDEGGAGGSRDEGNFGEGRFGRRRTIPGGLDSDAAPSVPPDVNSDVIPRLGRE